MFYCAGVLDGKHMILEGNIIFVLCVDKYEYVCVVSRIVYGKSGL